jgi:O-antigen/teichoic acid export membrane protein
MFGVLAGFGLGLAATKFIAQYRITDPERAGRFVGVSTVISCSVALFASALMVILAPLVADKALHDQSMTPLVRDGALLVLFSSIAGAQSGILAGMEAFKSIAKANLARGLVCIPLVVLGAKMFNVRGTVWGLSATAAVACIVSWKMIRSECITQKIPVVLSRVKQDWLSLLSFSLPAFVNGAVPGPAMWVSSTLLVTKASYAEMGIFNACFQWRMALLFIPAMVGQVMLPVASSLSTPSDKNRRRRSVYAGLAINAAVALPPAVILILFRTQIMRLYGPSFASGGATLALTVVSAFMVAMLVPVGNAILAAGGVWAGAAINAIWGIVLVALTWKFVEMGWGATGVALAYVGAYGVHVVTHALVARKLL